ncbi:unnamed protein product [Cylindrotheca closterium]|uniref:Anaphase-promoting complex subunit 6 n=1 Tax=Cylindrotheca closterium TaxID=2856 RepID=A0AAD2CV06_9STRA|nr:unnamed protein product [Cylindrotheca closterium]
MSTSNRSPYPTRSRSRRLAQEQRHGEEEDDDEADESMRMPDETTTPTAADGHEARHRNRGLYTPSMPSGATPDAPNVSARADRINRLPRTSLGSVGSAGSGSFRLGQGLLHARLSPMNASSANAAGSGGNNASMQQQQQLSTPSISPASTSSSMSFSMPSSVSANKPKRFFPAVPTTREAESEQEADMHIDVPSQKQQKAIIGKEEYLDGMPIHQLRSLAQQQHSAKISVFYAGIVFAKTQKPSDAYLYASLLVENKEYKRAVRLLETNGLLHYTYSKIKPLASASSIGAQALILPATLLAARALSHLEEWQSMLTLLEDNILYTTLANLTANLSQTAQHAGLVLEDDDDIAWMALGEQVLQYQQQQQQQQQSQQGSNGYGGTLPPMNEIHPLALLLNLRATAYSKTGHPLRASIFWRKTLQLDPKCVPALDGYLESTSVLDSQSALTPQQLVDSLSFPPHFEFLKDFYLAKLLGGISSRGNAKDDINKMDTTQNSTPFWHDETSSIQLTSPRNALTPNNQNDTLDFSISARSMDFKSHGKAKEDGKNENSSALDQLWTTHKLQKSSEVLAMAAEKAYQQHDFRKALKFCEELSKLDPLCPTAGYTYVATLVSLQKKRPLFSLAHEWVDAAPKSSKAWFAVGAYYYACQRYHVAQRHFCRATRLDPHSPEAWIAFGTSFAMCDESDQALASFRAAQRLSPGDATSLLYIGMEYLRTNHLVLAHHFLQASHHANPHDPLVCNEIGVLYMTTSFQNTDYDVTPTQKYEMAIEWLTKALVLATGHVSLPRGDNEQNEEVTTLMELFQSTSLQTMSNGTYWEPTLFNLAIAHRKLKNYKVAIECLTVCLSWKESASAYAALGYCHHLKHFSKQTKSDHWSYADEEDDSTGGHHIHMAIEHYHQSLSRKPDDPFCTEMLQRALSDALEEQVFLPPTDDETVVRDKDDDKLEMNKMQNRASAAAASAMTPTNNNDQSSMMLTVNDDGGFSFSIDQDDDSDVEMG